MNIEAGRFRHRVRLERLEPFFDSQGDEVQDPTTGEVPREWREVATVWAAIEPLSAREFIQSQAKQSQVTTRVIIRHRDDVDAAMRAVHLRRGRSDVVYNIHGVLADPDSGLSHLTLPCSQGVGDGQ